MMDRSEQAPRKKQGSKSCAPRLNTRGMPVSWLGGGNLPETRRYESWVAGRSSEDANRHRPRTRQSKGVDSKAMTTDPAFPMFAKLPKELRLRVWEMAVEQPRVVIIYSATHEDGDDIPSSFISPTPPPAILQVCTESRGIALTKYDILSMAIRQPDNSSSTADSSIAPLYINFAHDVLYFRADLENRSPDGESCVFKFMDTIPRPFLEKIRSIGIDINTTGNCYACDWKFLARLPGLEVLFLGREIPMLDLDGYLSFTPLKEEDWLGFVEDYKVNFESVHGYLSNSDEKAVVEVVEEIKTDCIWWWDDWELEEFEVARKPDVCLVTVENS